MSASEKLKARLYGEDSYEALDVVERAALVAVVEAVEKAEAFLLPGQRQNMHGGQMAPAMFCAMSPEEWEAILAALAALEEKLP